MPRRVLTVERMEDEASAEIRLARAMGKTSGHRSTQSGHRMRAESAVVASGDSVVHDNDEQGRCKLRKRTKCSRRLLGAGTAAALGASRI